MLNEGQQRAYDRAMETDDHLTITGPAGSGKTFLTKYILDGLDAKMKRVVICAPTHQAKIVLTEMSGREAITIHSLLRINPETYEDQMEFTQSEIPDLSEVDVIVIDEASMIDDDLFKILLDCIPSNLRVLGIGDKEQLQPVRHLDGHISPMFNEFESVELTEVVRQAAGNPLIQVATEIREGGDLRHNWCKDTKRGVYHVKNSMALIEAFKRVVHTPEDLLDYRMFAFTNNNVDILNGYIRTHVYKTTEPFVMGEYFVMQAPVVKKDGKFVETLLQNGEIVKIVSDPEREAMALKLPRMEVGACEVARMTVERLDPRIPDEKKYVEITCFWDEKAEKTFGRYLFYAANEYRGLARSKTRNMLWDLYWELKGRISVTKSLGASTIHKAQGVTLKGCCLYAADFHYAGPAQQRQLKYVGSTRGSDWCLYYQ